MVTEPLYDEFVEKLTASFAQMSPGDPMDAKTALGPLSSQSAADTLAGQVDKAVEQGATVLTGGKKVEGAGAYFEPTLLADVTPDMDAYSEELFARSVSSTRSPRPTRPWTSRTRRPSGSAAPCGAPPEELARETADRLEVGMAFVNEHGTTMPGLPFGGVKRSGFGRELGRGAWTSSSTRSSSVSRRPRPPRAEARPQTTVQVSPPLIRLASASRWSP